MLQININLNYKVKMKNKKRNKKLKLKLRIKLTKIKVVKLINLKNKIILNYYFYFRQFYFVKMFTIVFTTIFVILS